MRDYTALFEAGNKAQLEKLELNGHKEEFDSMNVGYLFSELLDEVDELKEELEKPICKIKAIRHEAADIANFAHMIILACDKELTK